MSRPVNPFRDELITQLAASAATLSHDQHAVMMALADRLALGDVALGMTWRDLNSALSRPRADKAVLQTIRALRSAGWIKRRVQAGYALGLPGGER